jgi:regulator of sigma E protease
LGYLSFFIILLAMIIIHEFGHFIVAKLVGISVETFSVGFGPRLFGFRKGETDYRISAIPLGGYVKFRGENMEMLQGKSEGSVDEFLAYPKWKRLVVAAAGPAFNIATAILIPTVAIMIGFQESAQRSQPLTIGKVEAGFPAAQAGLQAGDRVTVLNGTKNPTWDDLLLEVSLRPNEDIPLTVERQGRTFDVVVRPREQQQGNEKVGRVGVESYLGQIKVGRVEPDSPAARAGLQKDDKIIAINGEPLPAWSIVREQLRQSDGREVTLKIERGNQTQEVKATPVFGKEGDDLGLGMTINNAVLVKTSSISEALAFGWNYNWRILKVTGLFFKQIFAGKRSARDSLAGPIGIAKQTNATYQASGWSGTIELMGLLSLNLGIMNLLPIPVLDGGVILLIIIEALLGLVGLSLTMNVRERVQQIGFIAVLLLMGFVIVNDITRLDFWNRFGSSANQSQQVVQPQNK